MVLFDQAGIYLDFSVDITLNSSSDFHDRSWPTKSGWSITLDRLAYEGSVLMMSSCEVTLQSSESSSETSSSKSP